MTVFRHRVGRRYVDDVWRQDMLSTARILLTLQFMQRPIKRAFQLRFVPDLRKTTQLDRTTIRTRHMKQLAQTFDA